MLNSTKFIWPLLKLSRNVCHKSRHTLCMVYRIGILFPRFYCSKHFKYTSAHQSSCDQAIDITSSDNSDGTNICRIKRRASHYDINGLVKSAGLFQERPDNGNSYKNVKSFQGRQSKKRTVLQSNSRFTYNNLNHSFTQTFAFPKLKYQCLHRRNNMSQINVERAYSAQELSFEKNILEQYLHSLLEEYYELNSTLVNREMPSSKGTNDRLLQLSSIVAVVEKLREHRILIDDLEKLISGSDDNEMKMMGETEKQDILNNITELEEQLMKLLVPDEKTDKNDILLELAAGVGGQEAMFFTVEMFDMYQNYALGKGWLFNVINLGKSDLGGLRFASAAVSGQDVYKLFKFEGGVHRVQRNPRTEKSGRIHTSTMSVAVLPQPTEIDVVLSPKDLRIETCRSSGKGGQHVNTTDSAVRIVHLPTGIAAECQVGRSQIKNKEIAMNVLRSKIYQIELDMQMSKTASDRKLQVGSRGRSEKIRTYNYSQDRITDHRLSQNFHNISQFMLGGLEFEAMLQELLKTDKQDRLQEMLHDFHKSVKK